MPRVTRRRGNGTAKLNGLRPGRCSFHSWAVRADCPEAQASSPAAAVNGGDMSLLGRHPIRTYRPGTPEIQFDPPSSGHELERYMIYASIIDLIPNEYAQGLHDQGQRHHLE